MPDAVNEITSLVNNTTIRSGTAFYDGLTFHRIIDNFMIQGGDPKGDGTGGSGTQFNDEYSSNLQFTGPGVLALANSESPNTNSSQFFITTAPYRSGDFRYTIIGYMTEGADILNKLQQVPVTTNSATGEDSQPVNTVTMTSVITFTDTQNGVLNLSLPNGTTGSADVTVTATDSVTHETTSQMFVVTAAADTTTDRPFLNRPISPVTTTGNAPVTFNISATDVNGNAISYDAAVITTTSNLTLTVDHTAGSVTLTPSNAAPGVYDVGVAVESPTASSSDKQAWDVAYIPVYIEPAAPTDVTLLPASDTGVSNSDGITSLNNTPGNTLQFQVDGVTSGDEVQVYSNGVLIGSALASGTSVDVTTNGTATLADGADSITATQTLQNQTVAVGNLNTTTNLASAATTPLSITVDTAAPTVSDVSSTAPSGSSFKVGDSVPITVTFSKPVFVTGTPQLLLNAGSAAVADYTDGSGTDTLTFTYVVNSEDQASPLDYVSTASLVLNQGSISDTAGNLAVRTLPTAGTDDLANMSFLITSPVLAPADPSLGNTDVNTPLAVDLTSFINNGPGTTAITDTDSGVSLGGIALIGTTGHGTWQYSLDGTTFTDVGTVSASAALVLPSTAVLQYTPNSADATDTATIIYRAWDGTIDNAGDTVDLSQSSAVGGSTPFSAATDTAWLTVNNNAPVLVAASPSLGTTGMNTAVTISLTTFINNGSGTTKITDTDSGEVVGGIALTGTTGNGTWAYSLDGTTFTAIRAIPDGSALLLPSTAKLRYTPDGTNSETATITYYAWDTTRGVAGDTVDVSQSSEVGGNTAFSDASDTASLTVTEAPVLVAASPSLGNTDPNTTATVSLTSFINNGTGTTTVTDADSGAVVGGIAVIGATGNGTWQYSLDGTTFTDIGTVSASGALLLPSDASIQYVPATVDSSTTATIAFRAWDTTTGTAGGTVDLSASSAVGGTTAFSAATDTASLTINNIAPVLTAANPSLGTTNEDTATVIPLTTFINNGAGTTTIADTESGAVIGGIALTGTTGNGTWAYSLDGTTFTAIGTVSASSALLLPSNAQLRYTPDHKSGETATITYYAWDTTRGAAGGHVDLSQSSSVGGATAFSAVSDTAALTVSFVNNAPVLTAASPSMGITNENTPTTVELTTFINNGSATTKIADTDSGAVIGGIAVIGTTGKGTWSYSLDGKTFTAIGAVSASSALLLPNTAELRYTPGNNAAETATITYRAWDTSTGTAGGTADLSQSSALGGNTAFSTATDTASLIVDNVAPILTTAGPSLGATTASAAKTIALTTFINNGANTTTMENGGSYTAIGNIAVIGLTGAGTWAYSLDGTNFTAFGTVSASSALLLPSTATLRYTPDGKDAETAKITYRAWDESSGTAGSSVDLSATSAVGGATAFSTLSDTASLLVNDAPVLTTATPALGSTDSLTAKTIALSTFINNGSGTTKITDVDSGLTLGGIALTGTTGSGTWTYSLNGTTFESIGTVSTSAALLLPSTASLRYTPNGSGAETATITYQAWDAITGTAGTTANLSQASDVGGTTAFSTASDTASLTVTVSATGTLSGYVYLDSNGDGVRGSSELGIAGVTVRLFSEDGQGNLTEVTAKSPVQTGSDGSYQFATLAAGTYEIQVTPPTELLSGTATAGSSGGTIGQDLITRFHSARAKPVRETTSPCAGCSPR